MAGYDIAELIRPKKDTAHIQYFFTKKGRNLYCIVPSYAPQISIKNFRPAPGARTSVLGSQKFLSWKQTGSDCVVDLKSLQPGDLSSDLFIIKFSKRFVGRLSLTCYEFNVRRSKTDGSTGNLDLAILN